MAIVENAGEDLITDEDLQGTPQEILGKLAQKVSSVSSFIKIWNLFIFRKLKKEQDIFLNIWISILYGVWTQ